MRALTILDARLDGAPVGLRAVDGVVTALGPDVGSHPDDEVLDAAGMTVMRGLVNGHTHAAMTLFRGFGGDLPLHDWLRTRIWPAEARLTADDVYWGTRLAALEMIRSGTVSFFDMYWHSGAVARAAVDAGLRATVSAVVLDGNDPSRVAALRDEVLGSLEELGRFGPLVTPCIGPHAIYTVGPESLGWIAGVSEERSVPVQIHLSETREEIDDCLAEHGARPAVHLDRVGLLGPRTVLAHGCWLDDAVDLVAGRGATVVTNPASNCKLAVGRVFPYPAARAAGVAVGLGTDGAASNDGLDLLADVKLFALLQKHAAGDPAAIAAGEALAVASGARSALLGGGPLAVGSPADVILVRTEAPELTPGDLTENLVYAATGAVVDTTVVAGRVLMRGREVAGAAEVLAEVRARSARLTGVPA